MIGWVVVFDVVVGMFGSFFVGFVGCMVGCFGCMVAGFVNCCSIFDLLHCCCCPYFLVDDCLSNFDYCIHDLACSVIYEKGVLR